MQHQFAKPYCPCECGPERMHLIITWIESNVDAAPDPCTMHLNITWIESNVDAAPDPCTLTCKTLLSL